MNPSWHEHAPVDEQFDSIDPIDEHPQPNVAEAEKEKKEKKEKEKKRKEKKRKRI